MQEAGHTAATAAALLLCELPWLQAVLLFILDSEGSFDLPVGSVSVQCSCFFCWKLHTGWQLSLSGVVMKGMIDPRTWQHMSRHEQQQLPACSSKSLVVVVVLSVVVCAVQQWLQYTGPAGVCWAGCAGGAQVRAAGRDRPHCNPMCLVGGSQGDSSFATPPLPGPELRLCAGL